MTGWRVVILVCATFAIGCAAFYPDAVTVRDEAFYVRQAEVYASGATLDEKTDPLTMESVAEPPSLYPAGTALLMTPFVAAFGWRGAYLLPALGLLGAVLLTGRWIEREGRSPLFALVLLGFPAALVMGRVAMSDTPSMLIAAAGLYAFWRGLDRDRARWWVGAGLIAGASLTVREPLVLVFAVFFLGAVLRREAGVWWLVAGGLAGTALRPLTNWLFFGDPLYVKPSAGFGFETTLTALPVYLAALLVLVPGGLVAGLAYRGRRRPELVATVVLYFVFFSLYEYSGAQSGALRSLVLGPRFFLPLLPVLAFALAEVAPRLWTPISAGRPILRRIGSFAVNLWILGVGLAAFAVHPVLDDWAESRQSITASIRADTEPESVIVADRFAINPYLVGLDYDWRTVRLDHLGPDDADTLLRRHGSFHVVLLERSESPFWRQRSAEYRELAAGLVDDEDLVRDERLGDGMRLRIWRVRRPQSSP